MASTSHTTSTDDHVPDRAARVTADPPFRAQGGCHPPDEDVADAVEFVKMLAASSLGTEDARSDRLAGRREIAEFESEHPDEAREMVAGAGHEESTLAQHAFDLKVADELELRNYTFEAELRYRTAAPAIDAAARLAQLLDAKGFNDEAVQLYALATHGNDANSAWRLAVISRQAGRRDWASDFAQIASSNMADDDRQQMNRTLRLLSKNRDRGDLGSILDAEVFDTPCTDATYGLGSMLFAISDRADLARLAYCSALSRGHSLAAMSLLDLAGSDRGDGDRTCSVLKDVLVGGLQEQAQEARTLPGSTRSVERFTAALESGGADQTVPELVDTALGAPTRQAKAAALQRILVVTRTMTALRGFVRLGHDTEALRAIRQGNDVVCGRVEELLDRRREFVTVPTLATIWNLGGDVLRQARQELGGTVRSGATARARVVSAGTVSRFGRGLGELPSVQRRVVILRAAGVSDGDVAGLLQLGGGEEVHELYLGAMRQLRHEQRGEEFDRGLRDEVESCFDEFPDDLRDVLEQLDATPHVRRR